MIVQITTRYNQIMQDLVNGKRPGRPTDAMWDLLVLFPHMSEAERQKRVDHVLAHAGLAYDGFPIGNRCGAYIPTAEEQVVFRRIIEDAKAERAARLAGAA